MQTKPYAPTCHHVTPLIRTITIQEAPTPTGGVSPAMGATTVALHHLRLQEASRTVSVFSQHIP